MVVCGQFGMVFAYCLVIVAFSNTTPVSIPDQSSGFANLWAGNCRHDDLRAGLHAISRRERMV